MSEDPPFSHLELEIAFLRVELAELRMERVVRLGDALQKVEGKRWDFRSVDSEIERVESEILRMTQQLGSVRSAEGVAD